jgi:hypothetical protein
MQYMTPTWTLHFSGLPLSPNDHVHWRTRARWARHWKEQAGIQLRLHHVPALDRIKVSAVIYRRNLGVADEDNDRSRIKPILDGLVAAGVLANDTREHVSWGSVTEARGKSGLTLIIEEAA